MKLLQPGVWCLIAMFSCMLGGRLPAVDIPQHSSIASKVNQRGVQTSLVVDQDDVIHEIVKDPEDNRGTVVAGNLGVRITRSGDLFLKSVLPADKIAFAARRVSFSETLKIHVILAWGFSDTVKAANFLICHLYIFREDHGQFKESTHAELGDRFLQFIVEDLNRDGNYKVLVATQSFGFQDMDIWQIDKGGEVKHIQTIDGDQVFTLADRFLDDSPAIVAYTKAENCRAAQICYAITQYKWSAKENKYVAGSREWNTSAP